MRWLALIFVVLTPLAALANEEDKGRLTTFLEDTLSGAGRQVEIQGFEGALSSHAKMQALVISDSQGVWLTLRDIELIWSRAALLKGRIEIEKMVAAEILLDRRPVSEPETPTPEAGSFALPDLPVSLRIGEINAAQIVLGPSVLGEAVTLSAQGEMHLVNGEGSIALGIERTDDKHGLVNIEAGFANADQVLDINLDLDEGPEGIVANAVSLPGLPSVRLNLAGSGPLDAYLAEMKLETDGVKRLNGSFTTRLQPELNEKAVEIGASRVFEVDLIGDLAPLFVPEHQAFFGDKVSVTALARQLEDGRTRLDHVLVNTRSFQTSGEMTVAANGLPLAMAFDVTIADPEGTPVLLPGTGGISLADGQLDLRYDNANADRWSLRGRLNDLAGPDLNIASITLDGTGAIHHHAAPNLSADISLSAVGVAAADPEHPEIANALGNIVRLSTNLDWQAGNPLQVNHLMFDTEQNSVTASGKISGPIEAFTISGRADLNIADLAFLEPFVKRPLRGGITASLSGELAPLTGAFDVLVAASGDDLATGESTVDALTGGRTALNLSAKRSGEGLVLRQFNLRGDALQATAAGDLTTGEGLLSFDLVLDDIGRLTPDFSGAVALKGHAVKAAQGWQADLTGTLPGDTVLSAGVVTPRSGGSIIDLDLQTRRVQALFPALAGTATIKATASKRAAGWDINVTGSGSSGFSLMADGRVQNDLRTADLSLSGAVPLEALNTLTSQASLRGRAGFDLVINGPFALPSVTGTIQTSNARLALPQFKLALSGINANIAMRNSTASIDLHSDVVAGGQLAVSGSMGLSAPFQAGFDIALNNAKYLYEDLLETVLLGQIRIDGPLTGGASISGLIDLENTEIQVSSAGLSGAVAIPDIRHRHEPPSVFRTRKHASAVKTHQAGAGASTPPYLLDLTIRADNKVFVRGLGLDAEFAGQFALQGTTDNIVTSGEFNLSRGRLDFLTKRLDLTEGLIRLEGDFVPYIRMIAETRTSAASFEIVLQGRATAPELEINASPDMPDEEALSYILFGEDISSISPFQAAQLAAAVASLGGQGAGGFLSKLRSGIGLENLDVTTDETGTASVSAGKHISDNLYTEIGVDGKGQSSISLNLDVSPKITITGSVDSESNTGIGLFYKKDY